MVIGDSTAHLQQENEEEVEVVTKKGNWESVAIRLNALCGGLEKYDSLEDVGWSAQEKRRIKGNSLPRTPELIRRRLPSSSFSFEPKASSLPRNRSQSDVLTIPTLKTRSRSCEVVRNIGLCSNGSVETVQDGIRTTTL